MKQKLAELQGEIDEFIIAVGDLNTPLSERVSSSKQKINKDILDLNNTSHHSLLISTEVFANAVS